MSIWTQVAGSILIDNYGLFHGVSTEEVIAEIKDKLGEISTFENYNSETKLPSGTEGSLRYEVLRTSDDSSVQNIVLVFFGNLRDCDESDIPEFESWLKGGLAGEFKTAPGFITRNAAIRTGVFTLDVDGFGSVIYNWTRKREWERMGK